MSNPLSQHEPRFGTRECERIRSAARAKALRVGLNEDDAEDCAQECAIRIWRSCEAGKISNADLQTNEALLYRCSENGAKNSLRAYRRRRRYEKPEVEFDPEVNPFPDPPDPHLFPEDEVCMQDLSR